MIDSHIPGAQALARFNSIYRRSDQLYHDIALRLGLSDSAFEVLYALAFYGESCTQQQICTCVYLSKQTVNSTVAKLCSEGYLELRDGKGRSRSVHLTEKGRELVDERIRPVIAAECQAFSQVDPVRLEAALSGYEYYLTAFEGLASDLPDARKA